MNTSIAKLSLVICIFVCGISSAYTQTDLRISQSQISDMRISTDGLVPVSSVLSKNYPAQVTIPNLNTRVLTPVLPGLVNILYVAEGDNIRKGQELAQISSPAFLEAQQNYLDALSRQAVLSRNNSRNAELIKDGIISEKAYLTGQSDLNEADTFLARTRQSLLFAGMSDAQIEELAKSRRLLRTMAVIAPFDGTVLSQMVTTGEHVDEMTPLYHVGQLDQLWLEIHVPLWLRSSLKIGNKINIEGSDIKGEIITIGQMVHEEDQGILVRGLLEAKQSAFIPGQFVNVTLEQKINRGTFYQIPAGSVIRDNNEATLFVRSSDGFLLKRVNIIAEEGATLVVSGDLNPQDQIAISGIVTLKGILEGLGSEE